MDANQLMVASLDDIVFEHRNKEYGAFDLRKNYNRFVWKAFLIGTTIFGLLIGIPLLASKRNQNPEILQGVLVDLDKLPQEEQPPIEEPVEPETPPPAVEQPATIAFVEPEPVPDTSPIEETPPPTDAEIKTANISTVTVAGSDDLGLISDVPPPTDAPTIAEKIVDVQPTEDDQIHLTVEQSAEFPGGLKALSKFLYDNLKYPQGAMRAGVDGKVFAQFVVNSDGSIVDVLIAKGIGLGCDEEAQRVIKLMPNWTPGRQNGRSVRQRYTLPITFKLD
jgi:periplasmic protein TonB